MWLWQVHVVMLVVCKCGGRQFAKKTVTAMPVFSSDVQQYICKSSGARGFATMHHTHEHHHTPPPPPQIQVPTARNTQRYLQAHTQQSGTVTHTRNLTIPVDSEG